MNNEARNKINNLIKATVGGSYTGALSLDDRNALFREYLQNAFPNLIFAKVSVVESKVSLNSISAVIAYKESDSENLVQGFAKVHIESNAGTSTMSGVDDEYKNALLLKEAGWPVLTPLIVSTNSEFPVLIYPEVKSETLFQKLEKEYEGCNSISEKEYQSFATMQAEISRNQLKTVQPMSSEEAQNAPVQTLFYNRLRTDGRVDKWYTDDTTFVLPGFSQSASWKELKNSRWVINGKEYTATLEDILSYGRKAFSFEGLDKIIGVISHGDDHGGNIFLNENGAIVFDPAFAGLNPLVLSDVKAFAHIGFLPMAGMYFDPKLAVQFSRKESSICVDIDFKKCPAYQAHEKLALAILRERILPTMQLLDKTTESFRNALASCALLTINVSELTTNKNRGALLLPMAILLAELSGFSALEELKNDCNN